MEITPKRLAESLNVLTPETNALEIVEVQKLFRNRLKTFIDGQKWVHKPLAISPAACSRYGWKCTSTQLLECVTCGAKLSTGQLKIDNIHTYKACLEKVQDCLKSSHSKLCPWPLTPCPESFVHMVPMHKEEALREFSKRLESLITLECHLPVIKEEVPMKLGLNEDLCNTLFKMANMLQKDMSLPAVLLAATGWRHDYEAKQKKCLSCFNCQRSVALLLYTSIEAAAENEMGSSEMFGMRRSEDIRTLSDRNIDECLRNGNVEDKLLNQEEPVTKAGNKRSIPHGSENEPHQQVIKRLRFTKAPVGSFDPLYEHRPWCPWIVESTIRERLSDCYLTDNPTEPGVKTLPGWKLFMKCLLRNIGGDLKVDEGSSSEELNFSRLSSGSDSQDTSPLRQQLQLARSMLESWCSPPSVDSSLQA